MLILKKNMGNTLITNLPINHFFKRPDNFNKYVEKSLLLYLEDFKLFVKINGPIVEMYSSWNGTIPQEFYRLSFKSHMRDYEIIEDIGEIEKDKGIGVFIDFSRNCYLKLWKDKYSLLGVAFYSTRWSSEDIDRAKDLLSGDLGLGYNVKIIDYYGKLHDLCEEMDERDSLGLKKVFYKQLEPFASSIEDGWMNFKPHPYGLKNK